MTSPDPSQTGVNPDTGETEAVPFAEILLQVDKGRVHDDLSEQLRSLVAAVVDTLKPGHVQLTMKVGLLPDDKSVLLVTGDVSVKLPKHPPRPSMFFSDDGFNLVREDPNQHVLWRSQDLDG